MKMTIYFSLVVKVLHVSCRQFRKYRGCEKEVKVSPKEMSTASDLVNFAGVSDTRTL